MGVYVYSPHQIQLISTRNKRIRLRFCFFAAAILAAIFPTMLFRPAWIRAVHEWLIPIVIAIVVTPLFNYIRHWKSAPHRWEQALAERKVEISSGGVSLSSGSASLRRFERCDIRHAEEPTLGGGLYLRSQNRYRWFLIPKSIDHYEAIKRELTGMGIPLVATSIPPNLEEFVGVLLFVGTMLCAATVHSTRVLVANLVISALVAVGGFFVIGANPNNPQMRKARIGVLIPVVFAVLGLCSRPTDEGWISCCKNRHSIHSPV